MKKLVIASTLLLMSLSMLNGACYINNTSLTLVITNETKKKLEDKVAQESVNNQDHRQDNSETYVEQNENPENVLVYEENVSSDASENNRETHVHLYSIEILPGDEAQFDNEQGDEISITANPSINDKRTLYPTNNYFNYVVTYNKYNPQFEKFDINHADEVKAR